jgi:hypothetical protein
MRNQPDFSDDFENALGEYQPVAELDRIESRTCSSDNHDGREYRLYGSYVPIRPLIDSVASHEGYAIEHLSFVDEDEANLTVFVADLPPRQEHPAFTVNR